jgi:hypothetical protein
MQKGFLASLFDFSFSSLVTTKLIKFLYVLSSIVIGLFSLALVITAFGSSAAAGVITLLLLAPLGALLSLIYVRVTLEVVIALFRIMEHTQQLVVQGGAGASRAAGVAQPAPGTSASQSP